MNPNYTYNIAWENEVPTSVTVFRKGTSESFVADSSHPDFDAILLALRFNEPYESIRDLFDAGRAIDSKFNKLSDRVSVRNGLIYFDGEVIHGALVNLILKFHKAGTNFMPLVNFMEKIETNPNEHSREQLFRWLQRHGFAVTPDGDFVAYKGVGKDFFSKNSGSAIVDGEPVTGKIPNLPGSTVEMPRSEVAFDPAVGCSTGLHAGNFRYAKDWGEVVVQVRINPRDVVSVPTDSNDEKLRVCRYLVLGQVTEEDGSLLYVTDEAQQDGFDGMLDDMTDDEVKQLEEDNEIPDPDPGTTIQEIAAALRAKSTALGIDIADLHALLASVQSATIDSLNLLGKGLISQEEFDKVNTDLYEAARPALAALGLEIPSLITEPEDVPVSPVADTVDVSDDDDADPHASFHKSDFAALDFNVLRGIAKGWELATGSNPTKPALITMLTAEAAKRRKNK